MLYPMKCGYTGITLSGVENNKGVTMAPYDKNGMVSRCWITFPFDSAITGYSRFEISNGTGHWGVEMGNGEIIALSNPKVVCCTNSGAVVQFDMNSKYPANSPCSLMKMVQAASFNSVEIETPDTSTYINTSVTPNIGFTVYDNVTTGGKTRKCQMVIPIEKVSAGYDFTISNTGWGVLFPSGVKANLSDPHVLFKNPVNVIIEFTMDTTYDFDSPCILLALDSSASFDINETDPVPVFVPLENMINLPEQLKVNDTFNLENASYNPIYCTVKDVSWSIVSGPGSIENNILKATGIGNIVIRAFVARGGVNKSDFNKTYTIPTEGNIIIVMKHPIPYTELIQGNISGSLSVEGYIVGTLVSYQWYRCETDRNGVYDAIAGATSNEFPIPINLTQGPHYFKCKISAYGGAEEVWTDIGIVDIAITPNRITLEKTDNSNELPAGTTTKVVATIYPEETNFKDVIFNSSDTNIATVSKYGVVTFGNTGGDVTITAMSSYNASLTASVTYRVKKFVPVEDVELYLEPDEEGELPDPYIINAGLRRPILYRVIPEDASCKNEILFEVVADYNTNTEVVFDAAADKWMVNTSNIGFYGIVILTCRIQGGVNGTIPFVKTIPMKINAKFVPATRVELGYTTVPGKASIPLIYDFYGDNDSGGNPQLATNQIITSKPTISSGGGSITETDGMYVYKSGNKATGATVQIKFIVQNGLRDKKYIDYTGSPSTNPNYGKNYKTNANATIYGTITIDNDFEAVSNIVMTSGYSEIPTNRTVRFVFKAVDASNNRSTYYKMQFYSCNIDSNTKHLPTTKDEESGDDTGVIENTTCARVSNCLSYESSDSTHERWVDIATTGTSGTYYLTCMVPSGKTISNWTGDASNSDKKNDFLKAFAIEVKSFIDCGDYGFNWTPFPTSNASDASWTSNKGENNFSVWISSPSGKLTSLTTYDITVSVENKGGSDVSVWRKSNDTWCIKATTATTEENKCRIKIAVSSHSRTYDFKIKI